MKIIVNKPMVIDFRGVENIFDLDHEDLTAMAMIRQGITPIWRELSEKEEKKYMKKPIPPYLRWEIWERDDFRCRNCGKRKYLTVDHIIPEVKGGGLDKDNLQTLCRSCNSSKGCS